MMPRNPALRCGVSSKPNDPRRFPAWVFAL
ncbi:hypothetical protein 20Aug401_00004 [Pseudomonas phage 20Aug401]|uniref:Uncharacterized protein n=2 Tax=Caudoviricetes TaxID=2731619 RepID=A0AAF0FHV7_9CAUD|nr:hypothetical protein 20Aug401_00004 [Pseudomonas phage 20Aug401]